MDGYVGRVVVVAGAGGGWIARCVRRVLIPVSF